VTIDATAFTESYAIALARYLRELDEPALHAAYELGRRAVDDDLTVLDLANAHQEGLMVTVASAGDAATAARAVRAGGDFYLESLSAFEMVRRVFRESRDLALVERRHATMLRQLSTFLADTSLALSTTESVPEVLTLVVEHARELVGAGCALAASRLLDEDRPIVASSFADNSAVWAVLVEAVESAEGEPLLSPLAGNTRAAGERITEDPVCRALLSACRPPLGIRAWLAAPITALDGRQLGSIHLLDDAEDRSSELALAVLGQVAQLASAAIERAHLYQPRP
jgi:hypothetical protein